LKIFNKKSFKNYALYYITISKMSGKITKLRMTGAINMYFIRTGQHIECVEKLKKRDLEEIIAQYNINIEEEYAIHNNNIQSLNETFNNHFQGYEL